MELSGITGAYADLAASQAEASTSKLEKNLNARTYAGSTDEELLDACKQFESYFMEQVYKEMEKTVKVFSEDDEDPNVHLVDYFKDSVRQELSDVTAEQSGLGIAQMLYEQMKRNYEME